MALRDTLNQYIKDREHTHLSSMGGVSPTGLQGLSSPLAFEYERQLEKQEELERQKRNQKNVAWDIVGSSLWAGLDTASFGGLALLTPKEWEEYFQPTTLAGKYASGIAGVAGFMTGAPLRVGAKIARTAAVPFITKAGYKTGASVLKKGYKASATKATSAEGKRFAKDLKKRTHSIFEQPKINSNIRTDKEFVKHARENIDKFVESAVVSGKLGRREAKAIAKEYKKSITSRPLNDFVDLFTRNTSSKLTRTAGYMAHEAIMFGAIDGIFEASHMFNTGEDYNVLHPLKGVGVGAAFGALKWFNIGGKQSNTWQDFSQGIRGFVGNAAKYVDKAKPKNVSKMAQWLGNDLKGLGEKHSKVVVDFKGGKIEVDLSKWDGHGRNISIQEASVKGYGPRRQVSQAVENKLLKQAMIKKSKELGPKLMRLALKSEVKQIGETWKLMTAGTIIMNATLITDWLGDDESVAADDVVFNLVLGAWLNRRGVPKEYDAGGRKMKAELNHLRGSLDVLGINTKNLYQRVPTFDPSGRDPVVNPVNNDPSLKKIVEEMDRMGMSSDSIKSRGDNEPIDRQTVAHAKTAGGEDFSLFDMFKRYYYATTKRRFVATDDMINAADARKIQENIMKLNGGKTVSTAKISSEIRTINRQQKQLELRAKKLGFKNIDDMLGDTGFLGLTVKPAQVKEIQEIILKRGVDQQTAESISKVLAQYSEIRTKLLKLTGKEASELSKDLFSMYENEMKMPETSEVNFDYDLTSKKDQTNALNLLEAYRIRGNVDAADWLYKNLQKELKIVKDNDMLEAKELTELSSKITVANQSQKIEKFKQIGGIKDTTDLYNYLDTSTAAMYEGFKGNIFDTQSAIMQIIGLPGGEKRSNRLGTIPDGIAFNADLNLDTLAREGKLQWLTKDGKVLKGEEAITELGNLKLAVNEINFASEVLFNAKTSGEYESVTDIDTVRQLYELVRSTEGSIDSAYGVARNDYKFNFSDMRHIVGQIATRELFSDTKKVDKIFDVKGEQWNTLYKSLLNAKLIDYDVATGRNKILEDVRRIKFEESDALSESAKNDNIQFLESINRLVRTFNREGYDVVKPKQDITISVDKVEAIKSIFSDLGFGNKVNDMRFFDYWTREVSYKALQQKIPHMTNQDLSIIQELTTTRSDEGFSMATYAGIKKGAPGWTINKIEFVGEGEQGFVHEYNSIADGIIKRSKGAVVAGDTYVFSNRDTLASINTMLIDAKIKAGKGSKEQVLNFLQAYNKTNTITDALLAAGERGSDTSSRVVQWLIDLKVIKPRFIDGEFSETYNLERFDNQKVQQKLLEKLNKYDVNIQSIADINTRARRAAEELIEGGYTFNTDRSLSVNQFFNRYLDHANGFQSKKPEEMTEFVRDIVFDSDMNFRGKEAFSDLISKMKFRNDSKKQAVMDAARFIVGRVNQIEKPVLLYDRNGIRPSENRKKINRTEYVKFNEEIGVNWLLIEGVGKDYDKLFDKYVLDQQIDVFFSDSTLIPKHSKEKLGGLNKIFTDLLRDYSGDATVDISLMVGDGITPFRFGNSSQVFGLYNQHRQAITDAFIIMKKKYYDSASKDLQVRLDKMEKSLKESEGEMSEWHLSAYRALLAERMLVGDGYNKVLEFFESPPGSDNYANLYNRFKLFHPTSALRADRSIVQGLRDYIKENPTELVEGVTIKPLDVAPLERYLSREVGKEINMVLWNDMAAELSKDPYLLAEFKKLGVTWDSQFAKRQEVSGYDSQIFISKELRDYLNTVYGAKTNAPNSVKPIITSLGKNIHFFGKTMFVYSPNVQKNVFDKNSSIDMLATGTSDKMNSIQGSTHSSKILNMSREALYGGPDLKANIINLPLESIGVVKVTDVDKPATYSASMHNFSSNKTNQQVYDGVYKADVFNAIDAIKQAYGDPYLAKEVVKLLTADTNLDIEAVTGSATDNTSSMLKHLRREHSIPDIFGDDLTMNLLKRKFIDPIVKPQAEYEENGTVYRYGQQAPIIQDLSQSHYDLAPTVVSKNGKLLQYGQIMLPNNARSGKIEFPTKDLELYAISDKNGIVQTAKELYTSLTRKMGIDKEIIDESWNYIASSAEPLGFLHDFVKQQTNGAWQLGVANVRYPRTRQNDLMFLRVKDFLSADFREATIVNKFDVLNVMEGDYDSDVSNFFWGINPGMKDHIRRAPEKWVHTVDEASLKPKMPSVSLITSNARKNEGYWNEYDSNRRVVNKIGKGLVQRNIKLVGHMRDIAVKNKEGEYILYERKLDDGSEHKLVVDWDTTQWHERTALEGQHLLDYVKGVDPSIFKSVDSYRWDYLFPRYSENNSLSRENFLDNTNQFSTTKARDYANQSNAAEEGAPNKRIRIFRKFTKDKDGNWQEMDLGTVDKESIKLVMRRHNRFLGLSGETNIGGKRKTPNYQEMMDISRDYFEFYDGKVISDNFYRRISNAKAQNDAGEFVNVFVGSKRDELTRYFGDKTFEKWSYQNYVKSQRAKGESYGEPRPKDLMPWYKHDIFDQGVMDNLRAIGKGDFGTPLERALYEFSREDPLHSAIDRNVLGSDNYAKFLSLEQALLGDARLVEANQINQMVPKLINDVKTATAQIRRLNWTMYKIGKSRMGKVRKEAYLSELRKSRKDYEKQIRPLITKKYRETRSSKDLPEIELINVGGEREQLRALTQYWFTDAITKNIGLANGTDMQMSKDVNKVKKLYRDDWAQYFSNTGAEPFKDRTILNEAQKLSKLNPKDPFEIQRDLETELVGLYNEYGPLAIWQFAKPTQSQSPTQKITLGLFNGNVIHMVARPSKRLNIAVKFFEKMAAKQLEGVKDIELDALAANNMMDMTARLYSVTHNYFRKNINQVAKDDIAYANELQALSPDMPYHLKSMFNRYSNVRFGRDGGDNYSPFSFGPRRNSKMDFYRRLFGTAGQDKQFDEYVDGLSRLDQLSMENEFMHPIKFAAIMRNVEDGASELMKNVFPATVGVSGNQMPVPSVKFENNPLYIMLGGGRHTNYGYKINTASNFTSYQKSMMKALFDQGNQVSKSRSNTWDLMHKEHKHQGIDCRKGG